jgi:hypothetical protein
MRSAELIGCGWSAWGEERIGLLRSKCGVVGWVASQDDDLKPNLESYNLETDLIPSISGKEIGTGQIRREREEKEGRDGHLE